MSACLLAIINVWRMMQCGSNHTAADDYGAFKLSIFSFISLDNKLRYCNHNNLICLIGTDRILYHDSSNKRSNSIIRANVKNLNPSRLLRIVWVKKLLINLSNFISSVLYMDMDTIIMRVNDQTIFRLLKLFDSAQIFISSDIEPFQDRFQTGVVLFRQHPQTQELLRYFYEESIANINFLGSTSNKRFESDQYLFNKHIRCKPNTSIGQIFDKFGFENRLQTCRVINIGYSGIAPPQKPILIMNISRSIYNAFPSHSDPWSQMGLPSGDEQEDSFIVHFAGLELYQEITITIVIKF